MANKAVLIVILIVIAILFAALMTAQHFISEELATMLMGVGILLIVGVFVNEILR